MHLVVVDVHVQRVDGELGVGSVPAREGPPALAQSADDGDVVAGLARVDEVVLSPAVHS